MNPFDLPGPAFLVRYVVLLGLSFVLWRLSLRSDDSQSADLSSAEPLSPYEVAFLAGGPDALLDAAAMTLAQQGRIVVRERLFPAAPAAEKEAARVATDIGPYDRELEGELLARLPASGAALRAVRRTRFRATHAIQTRLAGMGLFDSPSTQKRQFWLGVAPPFVVLAIGSVKLLVGAWRSRPVGFLFILLLITVVLVGYVVARRRSGVTARGVERLEQLRTQHAALALTALSAPAQILPDELALAYGLFGTSVLLGPMALLGTTILGVGSSVDLGLAQADPQLRASFWRQNSSSSGSTDSSWTSSGSSCSSSGSSCGGSSCGGGGGGGCGGCSS